MVGAFLGAGACQRGFRGQQKHRLLQKLPELLFLGQEQHIACFLRALPFQAQGQGISVFRVPQAGIVLYQSVVCVDWDALRPGKGDGDFLRCRELHLIAEAVRIKGRIQGDFVPLGILQL